MAQVSKTRTYSTGGQLTAANYNDDRDEIISGINSIDNSQISASAAIDATKISGTAATLTGTQTFTNKDLSSSTNTYRAASDTTTGAVELATVAETDTGTSTTLAVTPDGLAGSNYGEKGFSISLFGSTTSVSTGDGTVAFTVPSSMNGFDLVEVIGAVHTKGVTGSTDIQVRRRRAGSDVDMLNTKVTIGDEFYAADGSINTSNDDVATGDQIYFDVDAIHSGTAAKGLTMTAIFRLP